MGNFFFFWLLDQSQRVRKEGRDGGLSYFPVSMLERDGQHMGVVTKALEKEVPPSSMMRRVLFMACMEPAWRNRELAIRH